MNSDVRLLQILRGVRGDDMLSKYFEVLLKQILRGVRGDRLKNYEQSIKDDRCEYFNLSKCLKSDKQGAYFLANPDGNRETISDFSLGFPSKILDKTVSRAGCLL